MIKEKYLEYFKTSENYYDDFIKLLGELVKHPSVAFREPKGIIDCANNLNAIFEHYGYQSKIYPTSPDGSPVVFAEKNVGAPKTLMFYHHYDVQPEDPLDLWQSSPWELVERNDRLYARGTTDDKGEIVISLLGMKLLEDEMGKLPINVKFIVEGEEEAGSNHLPLFTQKYPELLKADGTIWEGATLTPENEQTQTFTTVVDLICGLKGNAYYDIMTTGPPKLPRTDVHSGQAAATPNAAWRIIWALSTLKNDKEEILIDGFNELVADPSPEDIEVLKLGGTEFEEGFKKDYGLDRILLDRSGLELGIELALKPSLTICGIKGGFTDKGSKTIVPSYTSAKLDFRLVPNLTMEKVTELLQAHLTKHGFDDIRFELIGGYDPGKTPINHPFIKMLEKISTAITTPKKTAITPIAAGSGPAYLFTEYTPICFVGNYIGGLNGHAPNENIPLTTIRSSIAYNAIIGEELSKL